MTTTLSLPPGIVYLRDVADERTLRKAAKAMAKACFNANEYSKDRSTKVGASFFSPEDWALLTEGYNGFPRGVNDNVDARHERPLKYLWSSHAERNGIDNAASMGIRLRGALGVVTAFPCSGCMGSIIGVGASRVITVPPSADLATRWGESFTVSQQMVAEAHAHRGFSVAYLTRDDLIAAGVSPQGLEAFRLVTGL